MLNTTPEKTGSSNNMLIGGVIMCFVFFPLLYSLCSKRGLFILWHNIFSFVTSVCLSVQVSGGPSGGEINSVNLVLLVPLGLRCYWLPVRLLSGDPCEMGCLLML